MTFKKFLIEGAFKFPDYILYVSRGTYEARTITDFLKAIDADFLEIGRHDLKSGLDLHGLHDGLEGSTELAKAEKFLKNVVWQGDYWTLFCFNGSPVPKDVLEFYQLRNKWLKMI